MEFFKNKEVSSRVMKANPNLIYFRSGKIDGENLRQYIDNQKFVSLIEINKFYSNHNS